MKWRFWYEKKNNYQSNNKLVQESFNRERKSNRYYRKVYARYTPICRICYRQALVLEYKTSLEQTYAIRSANSMLAALNSFFRFLGWHDLCVKQFKVQKEAYCSEEKELTKAEYTALVRTAEQKKNERLSLVVQTICGTGIRVSELQSITVEAVRKGEAIVSCKGKTRKIFIVRALRKKTASICYRTENKLRNNFRDKKR